MPPKKIPKKYTAGLKGEERRRQIKSIREGKPRPKTSAPTKQSPATTAFKNKYGDITRLNDIARATGIPIGALRAVLRKGRGAYYSSGSRPNQTAESWARARMYSYITGKGGARKADQEITKKFNVKF
jgi:hypothetical protein